MDGSRIGIVGGLRTVDVVIGRTILILSAFMSHQFEGTIGYHLVGIHVGGSSGSTLNHVYRELVVMFAFQNFFTCMENGICLFFSQQSKLKVSHSGSHLGYGKCIDKQRVLTKVIFTNAEVLYAPKGLYAIQGGFRYFTFTY